MNAIHKFFRLLIVLFSFLIVPKGKRCVKYVRLADFEMLVFANEDVGRRIALFHDFEHEEAEYFRKNLKADDTCLDIGGNVGFFSMLMASSCRAGAVHVFEPIPVNAALIGVNIALNDFTNVKVNNVAVADKAGEAQFSISVDSAYSSMHATGRKAEEKSLKVPLVAIDDYLAANHVARVDVMKVDVEGAEGLVIEGASKLLSDAARRPRIILLELFDLNLVPFETSVLKIVERMQAFGYRAQVLAPGAQELSAFTPDMANKFYNVIFVV